MLNRYSIYRTINGGLSIARQNLYVLKEAAYNGSRTAIDLLTRWPKTIISHTLYGAAAGAMCGLASVRLEWELKQHWAFQESIFENAKNFPSCKAWETVVPLDNILVPSVGYNCTDITEKMLLIKQAGHDAGTVTISLDDLVKRSTMGALIGAGLGLFSGFRTAAHKTAKLLDEKVESEDKINPVQLRH